MVEPLLLLVILLLRRVYPSTQRAQSFGALLLAGFCLAGPGVRAQQQTSPADLLPPKFIPRSPTVSAFQRFDAQQLVNLPTGAAQLAVPLADISSGALHLPVSLAYSYTGLQVGQPYDLVGLGWALQAGSSVSRQVNGLVDDLVENDPNRRYHPDSVRAGASQQSYLKRAYQNLVDTGPDIYTFSLPDGSSGRFMVLDTAVVLFPQQPLHVRRIPGANFGRGFQITTDAGIRYLFCAVEVTRPNPNNFGPVGLHATAWHLTQVISAGNADTLRLHYSNAGYEDLPLQCTLTTGQYYTGLYEEQGNMIDQNGPGYACGSTASYSFHNVQSVLPSKVQAQYLDSITGRGASLGLFRNPNRELLRVRLVATTNGRREIKRVNLYQSHFVSTGQATARDYRLRLDSLQEGAQGVALPPYRFRYLEGVDMPSRQSAAKDYWGYFNGASRNGDLSTTAVPTLLADPRLNAQGTSQAADREPHHDVARAGALEQARYPTGGTTRWEYEPGRMRAEVDDIPLVEEIETLGPIGYDAGSAQPFNGGRLLVTTSGFLPFQVRQEGNVLVALGRPHSDANNRLQDFNLWHRLPTGDVLVTNDPDPGIYRAVASSDGKDFAFHLQPGLYVAKLYCEENDAELSLTVHQSYRDSTLFLLGLPGPGVRVRRTTTVAPGAPPLTRTYRYEANGRTSGLSLLPKLGKGFEERPLAIKHIVGGQGATIITKCFFIATSSDNRGLGNEFNKYDFYYSTVREEDGTQHGATVSSYVHLPQQFNDVVLSEQHVFRQDPNQPLAQQLLQQTRYAYAVGEIAYPLLQAREMVQYAGTNGQVSANLEDQYGGRLYDVVAGFVEPVLTEQFRYDDQGRVMATRTRSTYQEQRLVRTATRTSTGWEIQQYKRLSQYAASPAVTALRGNHFNPVVETQTWRRTLPRADSSLVGGHLTFYDPASRHAAGAWALRLGRPAAGPDREHTVAGSYASFKSDTRYAPVDSVRHDPATGRLVERRPPHGAVTSFLWGYNRTSIVAEVENATYGQVTAALGPAVVAQLLGPNPGTDAQVRQLLQPLRRLLPAARVTTFTHQPLVGLSSQTDPAGRTTTYEYDALGRLLRTRDEQGRILSQQQYHYAGH